MLRLEDGYSAGSTTGFTDDTADTAGASGGYFSSWGSGDRLILRDLYRRYACPKAHMMKKIQQSGKGRSCGHWPMWRAMAKELFSGVRKKISPTELENFFWDVISEGSQVNATLDRLLDCREAASSSAARDAVVPKRNVRRSATVTSSDVGNEEEQHSTIRRVPPRRSTHDVDLTPRRPQHDGVNVEPYSFGEHGVFAMFDPTTVNGGGVDNEFAAVAASVASSDNEVASGMLTQVSILNDGQLDASAAESAFACPTETSLARMESKMVSDSSGSSDNADMTSVVRRIIAGASPESRPPVERIDKGVQCDLDSGQWFEMMKRQHLVRMDALRKEIDLWREKMETQRGCRDAKMQSRDDFGGDGSSSAES